MSKPIPVREALRLIEVALEDESGVMPGDLEAAPRWVLLAHATMRPMLECIDEQIRVSYKTDEELPEWHYFYPPLATLKAHYDAVRPGWRDGK